MTDREALRERVKELIAKGSGCDRYCQKNPDDCGCAREADAAIDLAFEEAAKIASEWKVSITGVEPISNKHASRIASSVGPHIAAALRAYITPGSGS